MKTNFKTEIDQLSKGIENIQLARGVEDKSLTLTVLEHKRVRPSRNGRGSKTNIRECD